MFTTSSLNFLVLTLSTLGSGLPTIAKRDNCSTAPSTFTISSFSSFYPATGNTHPSTTNFEFGDSSTTSTAQCSITGAPVPGVFTPCSDPTVSFYFGGTESSDGYLNISQQIAGCTSAINGSVFISTFCIPSEVPFGPGTNCEIPTVSLTGEF